MSSVTIGKPILEVGCGTEAVTRVLAAWPGVVEAVGVDPSPVFVAKARELGAGLTPLTFEEADTRWGLSASRLERNYKGIITRRKP